MIEQTSGNDLRRRRAGRLAGALGLLLALALIAGGMLPAYVGAQGIPPMPHGFAGTVSTLTPAQLVPEGTVVQAFVGAQKRAETTVDADGKYNLLVKSPGGTVTFRVGGVLAHQSATWQSGVVDTLDLTIDSLPGASIYSLTLAVAPAGAGSASDLTNASPYAPGVQVDIKAVALQGYAFVNWTATPSVAFGDANAAETSLTMPAADVTVTANFAPAYALTMAASPAEGGEAIDVEGRGEYAAAATVSIKAEPGSVYEFVNWTSTPAVAFADAGAAQTTFTMIGQPVTVTANFRAAGHILTLAASPIVGGTVTAAPAQELYQTGAVVTIQAVPASGYQFSHWTAGGGMLGNPNVALTTFTMPAADVSVFATFTLSQTGGGAVCFIATAAYGSSSAEEIDVLREFRDEVLLKSIPGSQFVALYYRLSPPLAEVIAQSDFLREVSRRTLDPLVWLVEATGDVWRR